MAIDKDTARRVAHLARIEVAEADLGPLAAELSGILGFMEQLSEVDVDGRRADDLGDADAAAAGATDVVTDGGYPERVLANAPDARGGLLRRAEGGGMSGARGPDHRRGARTGCARATSARSSWPRPASRRPRRRRALNAFSAPTPELARAPGERGRGAAAGGRTRRTSAASRSGSRICSASRACRRRRRSRILEGFRPPYESTVTRQALGGGRGLRRQAQHGRVRHGQLERDLGLRPGGQPLAAAGRRPRR